MDIIPSPKGLRSKKQNSPYKALHRKQSEFEYASLPTKGKQVLCDEAYKIGSGYYFQITLVGYDNVHYPLRLGNLIYCHSANNILPVINLEKRGPEGKEKFIIETLNATQNPSSSNIVNFTVSKINKICTESIEGLWEDLSSWGTENGYELLRCIGNSFSESGDDEEFTPELRQQCLELSNNYEMILRAERSNSRKYRRSHNLAALQAEPITNGRNNGLVMEMADGDVSDEAVTASASASASSSSDNDERLYISNVSSLQTDGVADIRVNRVSDAKPSKTSFLLDSIMGDDSLDDENRSSNNGVVTNIHRGMNNTVLDSSVKKQMVSRRPTAVVAQEASPPKTKNLAKSTSYGGELDYYSPSSHDDSDGDYINKKPRANRRSAVRLNGSSTIQSGSKPSGKREDTPTQKVQPASRRYSGNAGSTSPTNTVKKQQQQQGVKRRREQDMFSESSSNTPASKKPSRIKATPSVTPSESVKFISRYSTSTWRQ